MLPLYTDSNMEVTVMLSSFIRRNVQTPYPVQCSHDPQMAKAKSMAGVAKIWMRTQEILIAGLLAHLSGSPPCSQNKGIP